MLAFFSDMKISARLIFGFGVMLFLIVLMAWLGFSRIQEVQGRLEETTSSTMVKIKLANAMRDSVRAAGDSIRNLALLIEENPVEVDIARIVSERKKYDEAVLALSKLVTRETGKALMSRIATARQNSGPLIDKVLALAKDQKNAEGTAVWRTELHPEEIKWQAALEEMVQLQDKFALAEAGAARAAYESTARMLLILAVLAIAFGVTIAIFIIRAITTPITRAINATHAVAAGDLSIQIEFQGDSETSQLLNALSGMKDNLVKIVSDVRQIADRVALGSGEISTGNNDLSARTESQASALEQTSSSMEELNSTLQQNAEHARHANEFAQSASLVALKGGDVVNEVVGTMKEINDSSRQIVDIISVIDGIAFQTNILALNAAVEAARAGEQGRGFAVVASEVRSLAHRSADAAKQIKTLISASVERVDRGSILVNQAGVTMQEIVSSIKKVSDIISEITSASAEQTAGIGQISQAVNEMDHTTQQNAALVEESAAAAESLKREAQHLVEAMQVFNLGREYQATAAPAPVAKPARKTPPAVKAKPKALPASANRQAEKMEDDFEEF